MVHKFEFSDGEFPEFTCNPEMPFMLYDKLCDIVWEFYKNKKK